MMKPPITPDEFFGLDEHDTPLTGIPLAAIWIAIFLIGVLACVGAGSLFAYLTT